jgi:hypothetical protein
VTEKLELKVTVEQYRKKNKWQVWDSNNWNPMTKTTPAFRGFCFIFGINKVLTQGLILARQVLHHVGCTPSPSFFFIYYYYLVIFQTGSYAFARPGFRQCSFHLCLPSSWYYTHVPPHSICSLRQIHTNFLPGLASNHNPPIYTSQVAGITDVS